MTSSQEVPLTFSCGDASVVGILHSPSRPSERGVVIVVGAPQYRVGSHRQFVLLARHLSEAGFPVLRFDYRGMGDSDGEFAGFEDIEADIGAAVDTLFARIPGLRDVVLWGLCDGASAISFYAPSDSRVSGTVLVNPWVRSDTTMALARPWHYYWQRLRSADFWRQLLRADLDLKSAIGDLQKTIRTPFRGQRRHGQPPHPTNADTSESPNWASLPARVGVGIRNFRGRVLLVLSGNDLTAQEFDDSVLNSREMVGWRAGSAVTVKRLLAADHTYSTQAWRDQVHAWTREWLEHG